MTANPTAIAFTQIPRPRVRVRKSAAVSAIPMMDHAAVSAVNESHFPGSSNGCTAQAAKPPATNPAKPRTCPRAVSEARWNAAQPARAKTDHPNCPSSAYAASIGSPGWNSTCISGPKTSSPIQKMPNTDWTSSSNPPGTRRSSACQPSAQSAALPAAIIPRRTTAVESNGVPDSVTVRA